MSSTKSYPYKLARVVDGNILYVEFSAWDTSVNKLKRKRLQGFEGSSKRERVRNAKALAAQINTKLQEGFILGSEQEEANKSRYFLHDFSEAIAQKKAEGGQRMPSSIQTLLNKMSEYLTKVDKKQIYTQDFSRKEVILFLDWLKQDKSVKNVTRNNYLNYLSSICTFMVDREILSFNPCHKVRRLPEQGAKNIPYTPAQKRLLASYMSKVQPDLYCFCMFMYYGFMRPVEIMRLKIGHIDVSRGIILVRSYKSKNKKQLPVVMVPRLEQLYWEFLHRHGYSTKDVQQGRLDNLHIFSKDLIPGEKEWARNRFSERYRKVLERTGLYNGELTGYSWKHTGVCSAYLAGLDIRAIQEQCRHSSLAETERYMRSMGLRIHENLMTVRW
ncbi:MAG: tyrosine-type recombinase/integrase [Bacteroidota bacterium]